jgi:hypothetical protein
LAAFTAPEGPRYGFVREGRTDLLRHRRATFGGVLGLIALAFAGSTFAASATTVTVTPTNMQGWVIPADNPPVAYNFNGPADSNGGNGSFQFGPISGANGAKIELQPPEVNFDIADFDGLSFEYDVLAPVSSGASEDYVYVSVYVDSAANGLGFFGSGITSSGFYDCRYTFVADTNDPGWNTLSFNAATIPDSLATRHSSCAATLGGNTGNLLFFRLNGGDTSGNDNGMRAAFDLVAITLDGDTTIYDFEPYVAASSKDDCKDGGWMDVTRGDGGPFKNQGDCIQYVNTGK